MKYEFIVYFWLGKEIFVIFIYLARIIIMIVVTIKKELDP